MRRWVGAFGDAAVLVVISSRRGYHRMWAGAVAQTSAFELRLASVLACSSALAFRKESIPWIMVSTNSQIVHKLAVRRMNILISNNFICSLKILATHEYTKYKHTPATVNHWLINYTTTMQHVCTELRNYIIGYCQTNYNRKTNNRTNAKARPQKKKQITGCNLNRYICAH